MGIRNKNKEEKRGLHMKCENWQGSYLPHGIDLNVNFPSASDTAWQRAFLFPGPGPAPWGQFTSETSSEYKYIWTPNIGLPYMWTAKHYRKSAKVKIRWEEGKKTLTLIVQKANHQCQHITEIFAVQKHRGKDRPMSTEATKDWPLCWGGEENFLNKTYLSYN